MGRLSTTECTYLPTYLAVFCCSGKDVADEFAYLVDLFVSGGKGLC